MLVMNHLMNIDRVLVDGLFMQSFGLMLVGVKAYAALTGGTS